MLSLSYHIHHIASSKSRKKRKKLFVYLLFSREKYSCPVDAGKGETMKEKSNKKWKSQIDPSMKVVDTNPQSVSGLVNGFGTYNIQPTANSVNEFPAIAQGDGAREAKVKNKNRKTR